MPGLKHLLSLLLCLVLLACSRTEISFEGRANKNGVRINIKPVYSPDASVGVPDTGVKDMPRPDAGIPGDMFRVTVYDQQRPLPGIEVVFHEPSGDFKHYQRTDSTGTVAREIKANSMLTVIVPSDPNGSGSELNAFTYTGLVPGEHIHVGKRSKPRNNSRYPLRIEFVDIPEDAGELSLEMGCQQDNDRIFGNRVELELNPDCLDSNGRLNVLVRGEPRNQSGARWFAYAVDQEIVAERDNSIEVREWSFGGTEGVNVSVRELPNDLEWSYLEAGPYRNERRYPAGAKQQEASVRFDETVLFPGGFGNGNVDRFFRAAYGFGFESDQGGYSLYESSTDRNRNVLNAKDDFLGGVREVTAQRSGRSNRPVITWSETSHKTQPDGRFALLRINSGRRSLRWMAILSPDINTRFEFPQMPPQMEEYGWIESGRIQARQLISFESGFIDGYDELRKNYGTNAFEERRLVDTVSRFAIGGDLDFQ